MAQTDLKKTLKSSETDLKITSKKASKLPQKDLTKSFITLLQLKVILVNSIIVVKAWHQVYFDHQW